MSEPPEEPRHPDLDDDVFDVEPMPAPAGGDTGHEPVVEIYRACLRCGYDLRGLVATGNCPECNTPVFQSLQGAKLRFAEPSYVRTLRTGAALVCAAITLLVLGFLAQCLGSSYGLAGGGIAGELLSMLTSALQIIGWWLLSTPDKALVERDPGGVPRRIVRIGSGVYALCWLAGFVTVAAGGFSPLAMMGPTYIWISVARFIAWLTVFFGGLEYARLLGDRLDSHDIQTQAVTTRNISLLFVALIVVGILATMVAGACGGVLIGAVGALMLFALMGMYAWLMFTLVGALGDVLRAARRELAA